MLEHPIDEFPAHVGLGAAAERPVAHLHCDRVDGVRGRAQCLDLRLIFHRSERTGDRVGGTERDVGHHRLEREREPAPRLVADGDATGTAREHPDHRHGVAPLGPGGQRAGPVGRHAGRLEFRDHQRGFAVPRQHQHREAFQGHGLVAREVRESGAHREQQCVDPRQLQRIPDARLPVGEDVGGHRRS